MELTRAEAKPHWAQVPIKVRRLVASTLGADVVEAEQAWGGFAPSATFRLRLADGRWAFFKGAGDFVNDHMRWALAREERVYREVGALCDWAPSLLGALRCADWRVLLLEDLGPASAPPWSVATARAAVQSYAEFHRSTLGAAVPGWLAKQPHVTVKKSWEWLVAEPDGLGKLAGVAAGAEVDANDWLEAAVPALRSVARRVAEIPGPYAVLHQDTRSDNIRLVGERLFLLDWPFASVGPPEIDLAYFAQSIALEGGPTPEESVAGYGEILPVRESALDAVLAAMAGEFSRNAWLPNTSFLPRLRTFQRQQLGVVLAWAARRLGLPRPDWIETIVR